MTTIEMDTGEVAVKPRKRVSKNKKKNWSKYSDVKDVEDMLVEKRRQMRSGGLVEERTDTQLFYIDKESKEKEVTLINKRGRRPPKPLKSQARLYPDSKVQPARIKSNHRIPGDIKKMCIKKQFNKKNGILTKKDKLRIKHRLEADKRKDSRRRDDFKDHIDKYDLWADETIAPKVKRPTSSLPKPRSDLTPAVEVAHPGASYNPDYEDYQDLIKKATEIEIAKVKAQDKIDRVYYHVKEHTVDQLETRYLDEMSVGLFKTDEQWSEDEEKDNKEKQSDRCVTGLNPPVRRENKKTPQQRKKQKAQRLHESQLRDAKKERISINKIYRLKSMRKEFIKRDVELQEKKKYKEAKALKEEQKTRILGGMKFEQPNLELKLAHELKGSLRLLKPEGNLMEDRFHSLQKRNIIEPRLRAKFKRNKRKEFEKKGHKEITL